MTARRSAAAPRPSRWRRTTGAVAWGAAVVAVSTTAVPAASAHAKKTANKSATVVRVVSRAPYGSMLATVGGLSLYTSAAPCTGGCLSIWPPLVMPKGKKIPLGTSGLGTEKPRLGHRNELQVTFRGKALYTFVSDSATGVNGEGVGGFTVATT